MAVFGAGIFSGKSDFHFSLLGNVSGEEIFIASILTFFNFGKIYLMIDDSLFGSFRS